MKMLKMIMLGAFLVATPMALTACEQDSALENAAEDVNEGMEEVADEIDDATN